MPRRDVQNGPNYVGELITHAVELKGERYQVASLRPADPMAECLVPDLFEPVLIGVAPLAMRLRGFERLAGPGGPLAVVQEWHCEMP